MNEWRPYRFKASEIRDAEIVTGNFISEQKYPLHLLRRPYAVQNVWTLKRKAVFDLKIGFTTYDLDNLKFFLKMEIIRNTLIF